MNTYDKLQQCVQYCRSITEFQPKVALILGSGLGALADSIQVETTIEYKDIPGFPQSTVAGHAGRFVLGYIGRTPVIIMQGRVHYYEGYAMSDVVLPVRLMKLLGAEILFLTNAAGGVNKDFKPGTLMILEDHITSFVPSPLIGPNLEELGPRFPDMSEVYDISLRNLIRDTAEELQIPVEQGVYIQFTGPSYETPAEVRLASKLGADACGMSTACEAMVANHMGMQICGISCITNMATGISQVPLSHKEVQETADRVASQFQKLVRRTIEKMGE